MSSFLRLQIIAIKQAIEYLTQQVLSSFMTILVLAITLALPIGMWQLSSHIEHVAAQWQGKTQATVYLTKSASTDQINKFEQELKNIPAITSYEFKDADSALIEFKQQSGLSDIASALDTNPLPHVFILSLDDTRPADDIETQLKPLKEWQDGDTQLVDEIRFDLLWVKRLQAVFNLAQKFSILIGALIVFAAILIISNTIRLSISSRKGEIDVINRIGGTSGFIRRPFTYSGAIQGFLSGVIALLIILGASAWISPTVKELFHLYNDEFTKAGLSISTWIMIICTSTLIGGATAFFTVTRFLFQYRPGK